MIEEGLLNKAVLALFKYEKEKGAGKSKLFDEYAKPILIQIELVKEIVHPLLTPIRIDIPNTLFSIQEDHSVCFFCRSEDKESIDKFLKENPVAAIKTVISLSQVKKLYVAYKDRKKLLSEHSHFFCDASIMSHLYNLLGKVFGERNSYPAPIKLKKITNLEGEIQKAIDSTYLRLRGKNISLRFGHTNMSPESVFQNIKVGINTTIERIGGWKSIRSIHVKTSDSAALPLFSSLPNDLLNYVNKIANNTTGNDSTNVKENKKQSQPKLITNNTISSNHTKKNKVINTEVKVTVPESIKGNDDKKKSKKRNVEEVISVNKQEELSLSSSATKAAPAPTTSIIKKRKVKNKIDDVEPSTSILTSDEKVNTTLPSSDDATKKQKVGSVLKKSKKQAAGSTTPNEPLPVKEVKPLKSTISISISSGVSSDSLLKKEKVGGKLKKKTKNNNSSS